MASSRSSSCNKYASYFNIYLIVLLVWQSYLAVTGDIIVNPRDTEASVGETIELSCTSSVGAIDWHHLRLGTVIHEVVYKDGYVYNGYKGRFNATKCSSSGGECNLVIQNVSPNDAGTYICMETSEESVQKEAELVVYEQYPSPQFCLRRITCSPECNNQELSCNMKYSGNVDAFMEWRDFARELVPSTSFTTNGITTSVVHLNKYQSQFSSYTCQVIYPKDNIGSRYNWSHETQDLLPSTTVRETDIQQMTYLIAIPVVVMTVSLITILSLAGYIALVHKRNTLLRHSSKANIENEPSRSPDPAQELTELRTSLLNNDLDESWTKGEIAPRTKGNKNHAIHGFSVMDNEVFLTTRDGCIVEVFDLNTTGYLRAWSVVGLVNPNDVVTCPRRKRLYICDWKKAAEVNEIVCVDKNGKIETRWISENEKGRLSITKESNVIVAESWYNTIKEYSPYGGLIMRFNTGRDKMHLWHAIKLSNGNFVASFGDTHDVHQEVCILDNQGETIHSFSNNSSYQSMAVPRSLAIDEDGTVYVADLYNRRILMLTSELQWKGELDVTKADQALRGPLRICLHGSNSKRQLLVADSMKKNEKWTNGKILILDIKLRLPSDKSIEFIFS